MAERGRRMRVAVLASGSGSNLQAILDRFAGRPEEAAEPALVVGSRPGIGALERAERAGVAAVVIPEAVRSAPDPETEAAFLLSALEGAEAELVVLAGYLRLIPSEVVRACWGRMINIHPALLPAFGGSGMYGHHVHEAVLNSGARVTGVTVHFVDEAYDRGAIIGQWPVPVRSADDADMLAARVLRVEHRVLPAIVDALARGQVRLSPDGRCLWSAPWYGGERFMLDGNGIGASVLDGSTRIGDVTPATMDRACPPR